MIKKRIAGLDTLRGLGVLIVVLVHAGFSEPALRSTLLFVMPLFYLAAGCVYNDTLSLPVLIKNKFRRLIIPYLFYLAAGFIIYFIGNCMLLGQPFNFQLFDILSTDRMFIPYIASLWFFESIFWCYLLFGVLKKITRNYLQLGIGSLVIGIGGCVLSKTAVLPMSLDTSMTWLPLFYIGNMLPKYPFGQKVLKGKHWFPAAIAVAGCCFIYKHFGFNTGYCFNLFVGNIPVILLLTLGATIGITIVCCNLGKVPFLSYIGRNSLPIFAGHQIVVVAVHQSLIHLGIELDSALLHWTLFLTSLFGSIAIGLILRRYAPALIGERLHPTKLK